MTTSLTMAHLSPDSYSVTITRIATPRMSCGVGVVGESVASSSWQRQGHVYVMINRSLNNKGCNIQALNGTKGVGL